MKFTVPARGASEEELIEFALSFDGYEYWGEESFDRWGQLQATYRDGGPLPDTLEDLRACLFLEQRAHRHGGRGDFGDDFFRILARLKELVSG